MLTFKVFFNCCAEFYSCNSFMGQDHARFTFGFKKWHIRLPPLQDMIFGVPQGCILGPIIY